MNSINKNLKKNAIIFGGSGDLGREILNDLYKKGFNVVVSHNKIKKNLNKNFNGEKNKVYYKKCNFLSEVSIQNFIRFSVKLNFLMKVN